MSSTELSTPGVRMSDDLRREDCIGVYAIGATLAATRGPTQRVDLACCRRDSTSITSGEARWAPPFHTDATTPSPIRTQAAPACMASIEGCGIGIACFLTARIPKQDAGGPSSRSALGHGITRFDFPDDGLVHFDPLTASHIPVATTTDCFPEFFRLRLGKPCVFIPLSLRFRVGRVIRGTCHWMPPEQI
ncbi:hypothetical protein BN2476_90023 [Paraburkholderia piptadeniae]|uniref:Uncharacterized protein n=1 Tax=Paraburkholderia piptadeniae TaxID=1701573 RepID=A0A1N7RML7_9BURK|nr:hypothetical protein BN2476_90023 [Paraburkholderia piptadeniae]